MSRALRFLVVDAQPLFREGLVAHMAQAWPLALFTEAAAAGAISSAAAFDIVIVDMSALAAADDLTRLVQAATPGSVLVTAGDINRTDMATALSAGARGYLPKTMAGDAMRAAVALVLSGGVCFPAAAIGELKRSEGEHAPRGKRELEILRHLDRGSSNKTIARELGLSIATIKLHVQSILRSTGARNRVEATINARRMGLLPPVRQI